MNTHTGIVINKSRHFIKLREVAIVFLYMITVKWNILTMCWYTCMYLFACIYTMYMYHSNIHNFVVFFTGLNSYNMSHCIIAIAWSYVHVHMSPMVCLSSRARVNSFTQYPNIWLGYWIKPKNTCYITQEKSKQTW